MSDFAWPSENPDDKFPTSKERGLDLTFEIANVGNNKRFLSVSLIA